MKFGFSEPDFTMEREAVSMTFDTIQFFQTLFSARI